MGKLEQAAYTGLTNERARDFVQHNSTLIFDALPFSPEAFKLDNTRIIDAHEAVKELKYIASLDVEDPHEEQRITAFIEAILKELPPKPTR